MGFSPYTSLAGLNAVLGIYNIRADAGAEGSRVNRHHGLLYHIVNDKVGPVGVPIKASLFHNRPILARLEVKFAKNAITAAPHKSRIRTTIDRLQREGKKLGFEQAVTALAAQGITVVKRANADGRLYGLTYVDHQTGAVFNGSELGKAYSAKEMLNRFPDVPARDAFREAEALKVQQKMDAIALDISSKDGVTVQLIQQIRSILDTLTKVEFTVDYVPKNLTRKRKTKRRGQQGNS